MNHWVSSKGWKYELFDLDTDAAAFGEHASFITHWRSFRNNNTLSDWTDLDLIEFKEWYGKISVTDIVSFTPLQLKYRLWGTVLTDIWKEDRTGALIVEDSEEFSHNDKKLVLNVLTTPVLGKLSGSLYWNDRDHINISVVTAPLGKPGEPADKFISAIIASE